MDECYLQKIKFVFVYNFMLSTSHLKLLFPEYEYKISQKDGKLFIFDSIAKKHRNLTAEEWVRQHCLNYLTKYLLYPTTNIQIEKGIKINSLQRRVDIQVYDSKGNILIIIECKAPHIPMDENTLKQISQYQKKKIAPYLALTNGLENLIFQIDSEQNKTIQIDQFPTYL